MDLLETPDDRGYPPEYLLSRIRGRRARLFRAWKSLVFDPAPLETLSAARRGAGRAITSPDAVWRLLTAEYRWVYSQMNRDLRDLFRLFFLYAEIRTICICLRRIQGKKPVTMDDLLETSLLGRPVKEVLRTSETLTDAVRAVEALFLTISGEFAGLGRVAEKEGLRAAEQQLVHRFLLFATGAQLHPLMRAFFSMIIDARNVMGLAKCMNLSLKEPPLLAPGGSIPPSRFQRILSSGDIFEVISLVKDVAGIVIAVPDSPAVEIALYRGITRKVRAAGKDPLHAGVMLDYLWQCSMETMNISLLLQGIDLNRERLAAELVY
jgi:vacuolar-type H+-ATPase subunit C/Vma6